MAKKYSLRFLLRDGDDLVFGVREAELDRLQTVLHNSEFGAEAYFFWFNSIDGRSVIINLPDVQAVRFLWDIAELPPDSIRNNEMIEVKLRGRQKPLQEDTENPEQIYDLFTNLQQGPDVVAYPSFDDVDGEPIQLNAREVVWIIAPTHLLDEGERLIVKEDGLEDDA